MNGLRPFWRYYGGKWRLAPRYPKPRYNTIIEPFAGAAGYSLRYPERDVILVEKYHVIAEIWRYLIGVSVDEVMAIPCVEAIADLPDWVPQAARWLVGFNLNSATTTPCNVLSAGARRMNAREGHTSSYGWSSQKRAIVAAQVQTIRHWRVIEGEFSAAPNTAATWFIDPPYAGRPGQSYKHGSNTLDYAALGVWCGLRRGQTIVCEASGADWLPFSGFQGTRSVGARQSAEAVWLKCELPTLHRLRLCGCVA